MAFMSIRRENTWPSVSSRRVSLVKASSASSTSNNLIFSMQGGEQRSPYNESRRGSLFRALAPSPLPHYPTSQATAGQPSPEPARHSWIPWTGPFLEAGGAELKQLPMFSRTKAQTVF